MADLDFSTGEWRDRLDRIRSAMRREGVEAFLSNDPAAVRYATGFRGEPRTLFLTPTDCVLYTSFRTRAWAEAQTCTAEVLTEADPLDDIARRLGGEREWVVGVDSGIRHCDLLAIRKALGNMAVLPSPAIDVARRVKSEAEIALLRESQSINESVFTAVLPRIRPGLSERAVQGMILAEIATREELDGPSFSPIVAAGRNAWEIHHLPDPTLLREGDMVILDLGVIYRGYASDMTRTVCLGEPTERMRAVYATVAEALQAALASIRPGAGTHEVDRAARDIIEHAGHGRTFTHGLGHSIGLETHDPGLAFSSTADELPLEPGMVLTVEPGTYLEGEFGVRTEDVIVVREEGPQNLTTQSHQLIELPI